LHIYLHLLWQENKQVAYLERNEVKNKLEENNFIEVERVTKNYQDPYSGVYFQALNGVDLRIKQGTLSSIVGPSGAGKSTLLNILGGMIKPSTGKVTIDGLPIQSLTQADLNNYRRHICGFLWQESERNLMSGLSVEQNILYAMRISGYPREKRKMRIETLLKSFGIWERRHHKVNQISGGEAARASLSVALANEPKLLLADEPTGELDSETTLEIIDYLKKINQEEGITIVVVTHDKRFENSTDRSYNILDGTLAGMRKTINADENRDWRTVKREEVVVVNSLGQIQIPQLLRDRFNIKNFAKLIIDEENNRMYLESADEE